MTLNLRSCTYCVLGVLLVASSTTLTLAVRKDGPLYGEVGAARWMRDNTPSVIDLFAAISDPLITDIGAPLVFTVISSLVWWRWGRYPALVLVVAGILTGLTRVGDLVNRPRPTSTVGWSEYSFGNGGYPSGHAVFTVLVLGTVAMLARHHAKPGSAIWTVRAMYLLIALTAWSRVSRLEHWPLDVAGGVIIGATGLLCVIWLHEKLPLFVVDRPRLKVLLGLASSPAAIEQVEMDNRYDHPEAG